MQAKRSRGLPAIRHRDRLYGVACQHAAILLSLLLLGAPAAATPENLDAFLRAVEQAQRPAQPLRADGVLSREAPERPPPTEIVIVRHRADTYLQLRQPYLRALIVDSGSNAYLGIVPEAAPKPFARSDSLGDTDFIREDVEPFTLSNFQEPRIADESLRQITLMLVPKHSQYSLVVITIDREKYVPLKTLYYQETVNNLVKMRRDSDHVRIADHWYPSTITMEHLPLRTSTTLNLRWSRDPAVTDDLFEPPSLERPSAISWPRELPAGTTAPQP